MLYFKTYVNFFVGVIEHSNQKVQRNQHGSEAVSCEQKLSSDFGDLCVLVGFKQRELRVSEQCPKQGVKRPFKSVKWMSGKYVLDRKNRKEEMFILSAAQSEKENKSGSPTGMESITFRTPSGWWETGSEPGHLPVWHARDTYPSFCQDQRCQSCLCGD